MYNNGVDDVLDPHYRWIVQHVRSYDTLYGLNLQLYQICLHSLGISRHQSLFRILRFRGCRLDTNRCYM